jgi:hypothetical protein
MGLILEISLLVLLITYFLVFMGFALVKGRKYLMSYSIGKDDKNDLFQSQNFSLALSGLSITAIALFVSLKFDAMASFTPIILFFSISFATLAISWNLIRFPRQIYEFLSGVLSDIGVLSIGCGFLVFFWSNLSYSYIELPIVFGLFILSFIIIAILDLRKWNKFWSVYT